MIDSSVLDAMPAASYLVNIGRGKIVDTNALVHALNTGSISGAALDVVDPEPLPADHPLWEAPGAMLTPHNAGDLPGAPSVARRRIRRQRGAISTRRSLDESHRQERGLLMSLMDTPLTLPSGEVVSLAAIVTEPTLVVLTRYYG